MVYITTATTILNNSPIILLVDKVKDLSRIIAKLLSELRDY